MPCESEISARLAFGLRNLCHIAGSDFRRREFAHSAPLTLPILDRVKRTL